MGKDVAASDVFSLLAEINQAIKYRKKDGNVIIFLSLKRLNKNGLTDFKLSGPPRLNNTIAVFILSEAFDIVDKIFDVIYWSCRQYTMTKIEYEIFMI